MSAQNQDRFRTFNKEVLFATDPVVTLDYASVKTLKEKAGENERQRVRLCAHREVEDSLHEMFIVHTRDTYVRPHKHLRGESFHVIEGRADVVTFADDGEITSVIRLGDYGSGLPFYYRLDEPCYHTVVIRSDILVFHETKRGPFNPAETLFPRWAPDGDEKGGRDLYLQRLDRQIEAFSSQNIQPAV